MGSSYSYAEGSRTGRLTKLSRSGYLWKTWEGEMILDGLKTKRLENGHTASVANTWSFSIDAKSGRGENALDIVNQLQKKLEAGEHITVSYWSPYLKFPCRGSTTNYILDAK